MPHSFASFDRDTMQPSLFESTITGRFCRLGSKTLSHDTKKLLQSTTANMGGMGVRLDERSTLPFPTLQSGNLQ